MQAIPSDFSAIDRKGKSNASSPTHLTINYYLFLPVEKLLLFAKALQSWDTPL